MLDRVKLAQELLRVSGTLFVDCSQEVSEAQVIWNQIAHDESLAARIAHLEVPLLLPLWEGVLGKIITINEKITDYGIISVDGSQIYPDRHQGPSCFLINIGTISFLYGATSQVKLSSTPFVFNAYDHEGLGLSTDLVNCCRQELEFKEGLHQGKHFKAQVGDDCPFLLLFDGSLVCWLLESKDELLQQYFAPKYGAILEQLYEEKIPIAGYISLPKSRELVNIIRMVMADFDYKKAQDFPFEHIFDSTLAAFFLAPGERTIVFKNRAAISMQYSAPIQPYFFYLNIGTEIGRVEVPGWIAHDTRLIDQIARIIMDQCYKGYGYPIAIAEAHEAAVVKGPDRDFFYHLLDKMSMSNPINSIVNGGVSQKSRRKKLISF